MWWLSLKFLAIAYLRIMVRNTSLAAVILLGGGMLFIASIAFIFFGMPLMDRMLADDQAGICCHSHDVTWDLGNVYQHYD